MDIFNGLSSFPSRIYSHKTNRNIKRIGIKHKKRNEPFEIRTRKQWGFIKPFLSVVTGRAVRLGFVCQNWTLGIIRVFSASISEMRVSNTGRRAVCDMNVLSAATCCRHLLTKHYRLWSILPSHPRSPTSPPSFVPSPVILSEPLNERSYPVLAKSCDSTRFPNKSKHNYHHTTFI